MENMSQLVNRPFPLWVYVMKTLKVRVGSVIKITVFCELKALS